MRTKTYTTLGAAMIQVAMQVKDHNLVYIARIDGYWFVTYKRGKANA